MKNKLHNAVGIAMIWILSVCMASCAGNGQGNNKPAADSTAKTNYPKMSAKERLAKNNILEKHNTWATNKLKGRVKSFSKMSYSVSEQSGKELDTKEDMTFDLKGNETESAYLYYASGKKQYFSSKTMYDAKGNDTARYGYDSSGKYQGKSIAKFDNRGNDTEDMSYDIDGKLVRKDGYKYDDKDNLIELDFNRLGRLGERWTYTYDENGFKTGGSTYDSSGKPGITHSCKFDANGNELEATIYNSDGSIAMVDTFKYDGLGHRTEYAAYKGTDSLISRDVMKYDDHGSIIETIVYKHDGSEDEKNHFYREYEYDATGNVTKETDYAMKKGRKVAVKVTETGYVYY